jgi:hypothetical protein
MIKHRFGTPDRLDSLLSYQRALMIDISYDRRRGRDVILQHDWPSYFHEENRVKDSLPEPASLRSPVMMTITCSHSGCHHRYPLDWYERSSGIENILLNWIEAIIGIEYTRSRRAYFYGIASPEISTSAQTATGLREREHNSL